MDSLLHAPRFLTDLLPEAVRSSADLVWYGVLGLAALLALIVLLVILRALFRKRPGKGGHEQNLEEKLGTYPDAKPGTGDRRLLIEGVPVRLRLVVIAPSGTESEASIDDVEKVLDKVLPGLSEFCRQDRPRVRIWPRQMSYDGFANHFHRNMIVPEGDGQLSRWAVVAGRVKLGKYQVMLGLALQGIKPNSVGRRTLESHEWQSVLRIRVRE